MTVSAGRAETAAIFGAVTSCAATLITHPVSPLVADPVVVAAVVTAVAVRSAAASEGGAVALRAVYEGIRIAVEVGNTIENRHM